MKLYVTMVDNFTGDSKAVEIDVYSTVENTLYNLLDGNMSCDCNRHCAFYPESDEEVICGVSRYEITDIKIGVNFVDREFYSDDTDDFINELEKRSKVDRGLE